MAKEATNWKEVFRIVLYALALAMGVATVVLAVLNIPCITVMILLGIGLCALALAGIISIEKVKTSLRLSFFFNSLFIFYICKYYLQFESSVSNLGERALWVTKWYIPIDLSEPFRIFLQKYLHESV